jgi:hypothetical protein
MGWFLRKSVRFGPVRINFSKRGIGMSAGVKGFRVGTGPRGPYVAGGRGGIYFRQQLGSRRKSASVRAPAAVRSAPPAAGPAPWLLAAQSTSSSAPSPAPTPMSSGTPSAGTGATGIPLAQPPLERVIQPPRYPAWALFALAGAFALAWIVMLIASAPTSGSTGTISNPVLQAIFDMGTLLIIGVQVAVCVLDWHGFITLDGRIVWRWLRGWQRIGLGAAYLCIVIMPGVYLGFACRDWVAAQREATQRAPLEQQRRISELEAQLGMVPQTEGECRVCHKPLQVGAEYCTYCRAPVREQARVCPACGAAALPDGQFCPKCGTALTPSPGI